MSTEQRFAPTFYTDSSLKMEIHLPLLGWWIANKNTPLFNHTGHVLNALSDDLLCRLCDGLISADYSSGEPLAVDCLGMVVCLACAELQNDSITIDEVRNYDFALRAAATLEVARRIGLVEFDHRRVRITDDDAAAMELKAYVVPSTIGPTVEIALDVWKTYGRLGFPPD